MIRTSEQIDQLASALATAQGQIQNPKKNKKVRVTTKSGRGYEFSYADLTAVFEAVKGPLSSNGLSFVQAMVTAEDGKFRLVTRLMHTSGQWLESMTPLFVEEGSSQAFGSALTFMKRYALCALLAVAADDDDDANAADGNVVSDTREYGAARKPKPPAPSPMGAEAAPQAAPSGLESLKPHALAVPASEEHGGSDWPAWGRIFIDRARAAPTQTAQDAWLVANQDSLRLMLEEAPKLFARLEKATADIFPKVLLDDQL
jgi:hypothetical protein